MCPVSLLDNQSDQPEDHIMATSTDTNDAALNDLTLTLKVIASNYVTKEELATTNSKLDLITSNQQTFQTYAMQTFATKAELAAVSGKLDLVANSLQTFQTHALQTFATKAEVANVVHQMTWRMAGFTVVLITAIIGSARYL
jgi:hypothetical protein